MTWRRVALVYGVMVVLAGYVMTSGRPDAKTVATEADEAPERSLLGVVAEDVTGVVFVRGDRSIHARREDGRWRVSDPADVRVPSDLIEAIVATLTAGQVSEVMVGGSDANAAAFGLESDGTEIAVTVSSLGAEPIRVNLGALNPTRTAIYARKSNDPAIFLVGMNLQYYTDLVFDAAARSS